MPERGQAVGAPNAQSEPPVLGVDLGWREQPVASGAFDRVTVRRGAANPLAGQKERDDVVADVRDRVVDRVRGMRDLVRSDAAESERLRTLSPAIGTPRPARRNRGTGG